MHSDKSVAPRMYEPFELRGLLEDRGHTEPFIQAQLEQMEREGRLTGPLADRDAPKTIALDRVYAPPVEKFLIGRMVPLAKSTVVFGPTGAGKSAWLAQLVFAVAGHSPELHGLAVGVHGPVLVVSAEDSHEDWERKAGAVHHGCEKLDVESAIGDVHVIDLTDGEARLSEVVTVRDGDTTRRLPRATAMQGRVIAAAQEVGAVLVVVETASRLVDDEDNASFSALQSSLGRIARATGAAVIITHHATKAASKENDNSIENARGGGSLVYNARNAISLFPAEPEVARRFADRFVAEDVFTLGHGKSTSSTKRESAITLVRVGTPHGAVFELPDDVAGSPEQAAALKARTDKARETELEDLRRLYALVESILPTRPRVSPSYLADERHKDLGVSKRRMVALVEQALREKLLKVGSKTANGVTLVLGHDPRLSIAAQRADA